MVALLIAGGGRVSARPNIVLIFPDNIGWGEIGVYGSVRGVPTPRIDRLAEEGVRLNNFNVEPSCTVSRIALLTGRYAVRSGGTQPTGMTLWEVTIAEALKPLGYATGLFGKWHAGGDNWMGSREPTQQGFDEWFGIGGTTVDALWKWFEPSSSERKRIGEGPFFIWEGQAGQPSRKVKEFDLESRLTIDREAAQRGIAFMERAVQQKRPFFLYYPMTQVHFPTVPHPDFAGKTGAGDIGDSMAEVDYNTGLILDALDKLGVADNTLVIWCADNGAESRRPWRGSAGPWSGFYNTAMEGGIRTPCLIRWPRHIPAGRVSDEIVHQVDLFPTLAAAIGEDIVPKDRAIDGVNQLAFLEGRQEHSPRQSVIYFSQRTGEVTAVKWKDWKFWYDFPWRDWKFFYGVPFEKGDPEPNPMRLFNLRSDPKEESDIKDTNPWVKSVADKLVAEFEASTRQWPNVPPKAKDPYTPQPKGGGQ